MADLALKMTREKAAIFLLTVTEADGVTPQDITGSTLYFHAAGPGIAINKDSGGNGIVVTNALQGLAQLIIEASDTAVLSPGQYSIPCELTLVRSGEPYELNSGTLYIAANVGIP